MKWLNLTNLRNMLSYGRSLSRWLTFSVENRTDTAVSRGLGTNTYTRGKAYVPDWTGALVKLPASIAGFPAPAFPGLRLSYDVNEGSIRGVELSAGGLTTDYAYEITARSSVDFTTVGAANNNVGTVFIATGSVTLDTTNKVKQAAPVWRDTVSAVDSTSIIPNAWYKGGVLSEPAATNSALWSGDLTQSRILIATTTPDTTTLQEDATTARHLIDLPETYAAGSARVFTVRAKYTGTVKRIMLREDNSIGDSACFDLSTGTVINATGVIASISPPDVNGVYTCSAFFPSYAGFMTPSIYLMPDAGTNWANASFAGNITRSVQIYSRQVETGTAATSYIPTTTVAVTRTATVDSYQTSGNVGVTGTTALTWTPQTLAGTHALWGSYTDANNQLSLSWTANTLTYRKRIAGVNYDATIACTPVVGTPVKVVARRNANNTTDIFCSGVIGTGNANTTAAVLAATFRLGDDGNGINTALVYLSRNTEFAVLSDAQCITLTQ